MQRGTLSARFTHRTVRAIKVAKGDTKRSFQSSLCDMFLGLGSECSVNGDETMAISPATPPQGTKIRGWLEALGLILGPGILLEQVGHLLLPTIHFEQLPNIMFLAGCGIMVALLWRGRVRFLLPYAPWFLCLILGGILIFNRVNDTRPAIVKWSQDVVRHAKHCKGKDKSEKDESDCVFNLLSSYKEGGEDFRSDLAAGNTLMSSEAVQDAFRLRFGIDQTFLGAGSSLPDFSGKDYAYAHIPEFLVPNRQDTNEEIWTWKIDPLPNLDRLLEDILMDPPNDWNSREGTFHSGMLSTTHLKPLEVLQTRYKDHLTLNDPTPIVIRFGQFPAEKYHGYLGRPNRDWVFTSHLGELLANHFTLRQAASESGYKFDPSRENQIIFVWVFIPANANEVVHATWHSVFTLAAKVSESHRTSEDSPAPQN